MTKFILLAALAAMCTTASATVIPGQGETIVRKFYGTKARANSENPCKGATIRLCGVIETTYNNVIISQTTTDEFNRIIFHKEMTEEEWIEEKLSDKDGDDDNPLNVSDGDWEIVWGNSNK